VNPSQNSKKVAGVFRTVILFRLLSGREMCVREQKEEEVLISFVPP